MDIARLFGVDGKVVTGGSRGFATYTDNFICLNQHRPYDSRALGCEWCQSVWNQRFIHHSGLDTFHQDPPPLVTPRPRNWLQRVGVDDGSVDFSFNQALVSASASQPIFQNPRKYVDLYRRWRRWKIVCFLPPALHKTLWICTFWVL